MFEILQGFERASAHFEPKWLVIPGLICLLLGLIIWLAGLRYAMFIAAAVGALSGGFGVFFASGGKTILAVVLAVLSALIAMFFREVILGGVAALMAVLIAVAVIAPPQTSGVKMWVPDLGHQQQGQYISTSETISITKTYADYLVYEGKNICSRLTKGRWAVVLGAAVVAIALAVFLYRFVIAACLACLGAGFSFVGMTLLLLYKSSNPITHIGVKGTYYAGVFAAMVAAGACSQLLLCRPVGKKPDTDNQNKQPQLQIRAEKDWRTS